MENMPIVKAKIVSNTQCEIICPICGKVHYHGLPVEGHRSAHCNPHEVEDIEKYYKGYYLVEEE